MLHDEEIAIWPIPSLTAATEMEPLFHTVDPTEVPPSAIWRAPPQLTSGYRWMYSAPWSAGARGFIPVVGVRTHHDQGSNFQILEMHISSNMESVKMLAITPALSIPTQHVALNFYTRKSHSPVVILVRTENHDFRIYTVCKASHVSYGAKCGDVDYDTPLESVADAVMIPFRPLPDLCPVSGCFAYSGEGHVQMASIVDMYAL